MVHGDLVLWYFLSEVRYIIKAIQRNPKITNKSRVLTNF
jgi:hypothetical protein